MARAGCLPAPVRPQMPCSSAGAAMKRGSPHRAAMLSMTMKPASLGEQLREWRVRRRMSQMDLALDTEMSTRHLSFIETGRSKPSAAMLQRIADCLAVPHRARNALMLAAGYAPDFQERPLDSDEMAGMKASVEHVLKELPGCLPVCLVDELGHGKLACAVDADEQK